MELKEKIALLIQEKYPEISINGMSGKQRKHLWAYNLNKEPIFAFYPAKKPRIDIYIDPKMVQNILSTNLKLENGPHLAGRNKDGSLADPKRNGRISSLVTLFGKEVNLHWFAIRSEKDALAFISAITYSVHESAMRPDVPSSEEDARQRIMRAIAERRGQPKFRAAVMKAYNGVCAFSDCNVREVLEAAHIAPYLGDHSNEVNNGILLRADLHTLFDRALLGIDPELMTITIHKILEDTDYSKFAGRPVSLPRNYAEHPCKEAIRKHRQLTPEFE